ncbi:hypothetical protein PVK06_007311 [Gossypium arboreum]|uniref:Uncharacterized protein n=1 Tax=Gossypium arboreum TaxID=29729 RepID=A0ABR0QH92_GOSAR|nr:hypothetical protein PVK06_007311 [Gossypium arboreum]
MILTYFILLSLYVIEHLKVSIRGSISRLESSIMRDEYLDKVEDNASVCAWSEKTQLKKGDSVTKGYTSELWDFTRISPTTTLEYKEWFGKRINDNIPRPSLEAVRSMEESLRVIPSELEVIKQEFERKNLELGRKIEKLEEEKMYLSLDVDVHKIEVKKERKENRKIEEDRDDLKTQYKRIQLSMERVGLGKSSE